MISTIPISEVLMPHQEGELPERDLRALLAIAGSHSVFSALEIGTFKGRTALALANLYHVTRVDTVDLPWDPKLDESHDDRHLIESRMPGEAWKGSRFAWKIRLHAIDSRELSNYAPFQGRTWDMAFIDGSHTYEACRMDTGYVLTRTTPGGCIVWHDYDAQHPGVMRTLDELATCLPVRKVVKIEGTNLAYLAV